MSYLLYITNRSPETFRAEFLHFVWKLTMVLVNIAIRLGESPVFCSTGSILAAKIVVSGSLIFYNILTCWLELA